MKVSVCIALVLLSCTSNVGGGGTPDAAIDASPPFDALAPGFRDGELCVVAPENPLGGCAPGYACVKVGSGPDTCRKECPTLQVACTGYTGPGYALCALTYSDSEGQLLGNLCMVVCGDENNTLRGCDDGACNGTCPETWTCETDPNTFGLESCQ